MNKYLNYKAVLLAHCLSFGAVGVLAADAKCMEEVGISSQMHHRIFDARVYPLQGKETIKQADCIVFHLEFDDVDVLQLMQRPLFDLDLAGEPVSLDKLGKLTHFASQIHGLNLMETYLEDSLFTYIERFVCLESLILSDNPFGDKAMPSIGRLRDLRHLEIVHTKITDSGLESLLPLKKLERLDVGCNLLKNSGIGIISQIVSISDLDVRGCEFDEKALPFFLNMPNLKKLNISENKIKKEEELEAFLIKARAMGIEVNVGEI